MDPFCCIPYNSFPHKRPQSKAVIYRIISALEECKSCISIFFLLEIKVEQFWDQMKHTIVMIIGFIMGECLSFQYIVFYDSVLEF